MEKALTLYLTIKSAALAALIVGFAIYLLVCAVLIIKDYFDRR